MLKIIIICTGQWNITGLHYFQTLPNFFHFLTKFFREVPMMKKEENVIALRKQRRPLTIVLSTILQIRRKNKKEKFTSVGKTKKRWNSRQQHPRGIVLNCKYGKIPCLFSQRSCSHPGDTLSVFICLRSVAPERQGEFQKETKTFLNMKSSCCNPNTNSHFKYLPAILSCWECKPEKLGRL